MGYVLESDVVSQFFLHRGDGLVRDPTGNDQVEETEIGVHVESETVRGHAARDVHADGGDLGLLLLTGFGLDPSSGRAGTPVSPSSIVSDGGPDSR